MSTKLWYNKYKDDWMSALPLGNGRIGAMVYGSPMCERIQFNEETLWSGKQIKEEYKSSPEMLRKIRTLIFEEKLEEAVECCKQTMLSQPERVRFYESFGEMFIDFSDKSDYKNYRKELELSEAIAKVSYEKNGEFYESEAFVSEKYDAFVYKIKSGGERFSCNVTVNREQDAYTSVIDDVLLLNGRITYSTEEIYGDGDEGMAFGSRTLIVTDGVITSDKKSICVEDATYVIIYSAFATNYNILTFDIDEAINYRKKLSDAINTIRSVDYNTIREEHIKEHKKWFETVFFELDSPRYEEIPTDERLRRIISGNYDDLDFYTLYYNFGRYLLIESSGKNAVLPANLQGIWCNDFIPPWGSDYHTNINLQMNYWPAEIANMSDTLKPFIHFMKMISEFGRATAKELLGTRGWVVNHTTDIFGRTGIHDSAEWGFFPMAGPWLCLNLWEHYEYTNDKKYLEDIYPIIKGSCEFICDFLVEDENGWLVTNPSNSPENKFYYVDGNGNKKSSFFTYGATLDFEIIYAILNRMISACHILNRDEELAKELNDILSKIPPLRISKRYGTICEWIKDYEETEPEHRHVSHLFALHPGDQINILNEEIYQAAKNTIARRLAHGGGATGWSRAWIINFYARLKDSNNALEHLRQLIKISTAENLFDMHPPFQIDGNFGGVSGITEMLIQSHLGNVGERITEILPALPEKWVNGVIKGVKARGGFVFDIEWKNNRPVKVFVKSECENILRLKINDDMKYFKTSKPYSIENSVLKMNLEANEKIEIIF